MSFTQNKLLDFSKKISSLPDQPNMQPSELKAYFDRSPEELQQAHNDLCDALIAISAASGLGFQRTAGVPADTVQSAVENVQSQLADAVLGNIPSGSVNADKLAQDVRDHFVTIENSVSTEASSRQSADSNLQKQINTHSTQIAAKCEVICGIYTGDGTAERTISLGRTPKCIILFPYEGYTYISPTIYGGIALPNYPLYSITAKHDALTVVNGGFKVYVYRMDGRTYAHTNGDSIRYHYIALV